MIQHIAQSDIAMLLFIAAWITLVVIRLFFCATGALQYCQTPQTSSSVAGVAAHWQGLYTGLHFGPVCLAG